MDEKILNKGKNFFIEQLQKDRGTMLEQTVAQGRRIGQLETELHLLQGPRQESTDESRETRTGPQELTSGQQAKKKSSIHICKTMVEIIPATKLKIDAIARDDDRLLVCVRDTKAAVRHGADQVPARTPRGWGKPGGKLG